MTALDEIYKQDLVRDKIIQKDLAKQQVAGSNLRPNSEPQEVWLKCPLTKNHCDKAECSFWIITYQRCCFVSIAKGLDILTQILDDRIPMEHLKT